MTAASAARAACGDTDVLLRPRTSQPHYGWRCTAKHPPLPEGHTLSACVQSNGATRPCYDTPALTGGLTCWQMPIAPHLPDRTVSTALL